MDLVWNAIVAVTALLAVVLSLITIWMQRQANRDQTFLRLHEIMTKDEMRMGRALLSEAGRSGRLPDSNTREYRLIIDALGSLNTAGVYISEGLMSRKRFIFVWHHMLRAMRDGADLVAQRRMKDLDDWWPYPELWPLFDAAATFYDKNLICCQHPGRWPTSIPKTRAAIDLTSVAEPSSSMRHPTDGHAGAQNLQTRGRG